MHNGIQINLQNGFMHFFLQEFCNLLEVKASGSFDKYNLILEILKGRGLYKIGCRRIKFLFHLKSRSVFL